MWYSTWTIIRLKSFTAYKGATKNSESGILAAELKWFKVLKIANHRMLWH